MMPFGSFMRGSVVAGTLWPVRAGGVRPRDLRLPHRGRGPVPPAPGAGTARPSVQGPNRWQFPLAIRWKLSAAISSEYLWLVPHYYAPEAG